MVKRRSTRTVVSGLKKLKTTTTPKKKSTEIAVLKANHTEAEIEHTGGLTAKYRTDCARRFAQDPQNAIARNAIVSVGASLATVNPDKLRRISHVFLNTCKRRHIRATNQGSSGRCWMFAALNTMRHMLIKAMDLERFEFSETYLFFWDKFERANTYLQWFIDNPTAKTGDRAFDHTTQDCMTDGGWWNTFATLVDKYGLVPQTAMPETWQSADSSDMNTLLIQHLNGCVNRIVQQRAHVAKRLVVRWKTETLHNIYNILVKFMGTPPTEFDWMFNRLEDSALVEKLSPLTFKNMVMPTISMVKQFVTLAHLPHLVENTLYEVQDTNNIQEAGNVVFLNIGMQAMQEYTAKSVVAGCPVWFAADVGKHFDYYHSALDDGLHDEHAVFGTPQALTKAEALLTQTVQPCHAMAFTGLNVTTLKELPYSWQVENSWGYCDHETEGLDGFLYMSRSWFERYVFQTSIFTKFLSTPHAKLCTSTPTMLSPWEIGGAALKVKGVAVPRGYKACLATPTMVIQ
jgi:bleomycin hydrolase